MKRMAPPTLDVDDERGFFSRLLTEGEKSAPSELPNLFLRLAQFDAVHHIVYQVMRSEPVSHTCTTHII